MVWDSFAHRYVSMVFPAVLLLNWFDSIESIGRLKKQHEKEITFVMTKMCTLRNWYEMSLENRTSLTIKSIHLSEENIFMTCAVLNEMMLKCPIYTKIELKLLQKWFFCFRLLFRWQHFNFHLWIRVYMKRYIWKPLLCLLHCDHFQNVPEFRWYLPIRYVIFLKQKLN